MRDTVFITTKPLQILVATSIIKQLGIEKSSHLTIVDNFHNAKLAYERMKSADWSLREVSIVFKESTIEAYKLASNNKFRDIFIDTDVGFRKYIGLAMLKCGRNNVNINVYEEGVGTYRSDLYSGIKKIIFDTLGVGTKFGGCYFTNSLYVFDNDQYNQIFPNAKIDVFKISTCITDVINMDFDFWSYVMNYKQVNPLNDALCNIYMSSWELDADFLEIFRNMDGEKFIKPHPHIKEDLNFTFATTIKQTAPAELVLLDLARKYGKVNVFHHGSSVEKYVSEPNLKFTKILM